MKKTVVLVILDGWGVGEQRESNPLSVANPPNIGYIKSHFPSGTLQASGIAVGLPWEEEGNSEVGHLTLGAGKTVYQHFPRITLAVRDKTFFSNPVLKNAFAHAKRNRSAVNLAGLLTSGNVHASFDHLKALLKFAEEEGVADVNLHLFADGKDSPPNSFEKLVKNLPADKIASVAGRYYAMDRDMHWDRTAAAYKTLLGEGTPLSNVEDAAKSATEKGLSEEFIVPALIGKTPRGIKDGDAVIFFNFREDSMRQIASAFALPGFSQFPTQEFRDLYIATMTAYSDKFTVPAAFPPEKVENPLARVLSDHGKMQVHIAETEKYAHVTYFFNGHKDAPYKNEYRVLIPSRNIPRHEAHPEMMAKEITARAIQSMEERIFDFIVINYANPDVMAHTGDFNAALTAIEVVDNCLGELMKKALEVDAVVVVTSDHGNVEQMIYPLTGEPETKHNISPVPIYLIDKQYERPRSEEEVSRGERTTIGILSDVAPTVLDLLKIPQPPEMTGTSLLPLLGYY